MVNPFALRVPPESFVCYSHTLKITLEWRKSSQNIWRRAVVWCLMKISSANIFQKMLWFQKYHQNCQACFGCSKCEWVNRLCSFDEELVVWLTIPKALSAIAMLIALDVTLSDSQFNPFTLRVPQESIVCYFHTFENNLEIKQILTKYLKESCWYKYSDKHFSFKYF